MILPNPRLVLPCVLALFGCVVFGSAPSLSEAAPLPIESLARFEAVTGASLAPDGKHVVGLVAAEGQKWPVISVWKTEALEQPPVWIPSATQRPISVRFIGSSKLLFVTEQEINAGPIKTFTQRLYITDLKGSFFGEPLRRTGAGNDTVRNVEAVNATVQFFSLLSDPDLILVERIDVDKGVQQIYRVDTRTMRAVLVAEGSEKSRFLDAGVDSETGELLLQERIVNVGGEFWLQRFYRKSPRDAWENHPELGYKLKERKGIDVIAFDFDPTKLVVSTTRFSNYAEIRSYDLVRRRFDSEALYRNDRFDIFDVYFNTDSRAQEQSQILGIRLHGPSIETVFFDDYWKPIHDALKQQFPNKVIRYGSRQRANKIALFRVESDALPHDYYLITTEPQLKISRIGNSRPWIDPLALGASRWVTYRARDGLEIPAILTTPPGWTAEKGRIPAVVHPHGGPWARDYMEWDGSGWVQFLATRGYAVLRPQYRGSTNLGLKLWLAGDENWGLRMQDDKDDGAKWLVDQGIADPRKIAIFGYSYGGFAAIAASVRPNGPYVCALSGAGVSSLDRIKNLWGDNRLGRELQEWTVEGMDPLENVAKADIPILLYHGDRDRQAETDHSRLFYRAMKSAGKDVQYVEIKDMWHTLPWRPEWHRQTLKLIEDWLAGPKCFGGPGKVQVAAAN